MTTERIVWVVVLMALLPISYFVGYCHGGTNTARDYIDKASNDE